MSDSMRPHRQTATRLLCSKCKALGTVPSKQGANDYRVCRECRKEEDLLGGCCINQVRDDSGLDKGNSNGVGSEETVFTDRVDVRCGSERVLRTTPSILA